MKKFALACILGLSVCSLSAVADDITGYISDAHCGAKHSDVSDANTKCIQACLKGGSAPVLVHDGKVMKIDTDSQAKAKDFAGQQVKINGTVNGDTVTIQSIQPAS
jgi:hypothetical protein